jgi:hypothetical protein
MKTRVLRKRPLLTAENQTLTRMQSGAVTLVAVLFAGAATLGGAQASADPASPDPLADVPPPPAVVVVPSSPPATGKSADGWTLVLSANSESLTPVPSPEPALATRDFIVGGLFTGTLRGPARKRHQHRWAPSRLVIRSSASLVECSQHSNLPLPRSRSLRRTSKEPIHRLRSLRFACKSIAWVRH